LRRRFVGQRVFACLRCILYVQCITPDPWLADEQAKDQQLHELYNQREHNNRRKMLLRDIALQEKKVKVLLAHARLSSGPNATVSPLYRGVLEHSNQRNLDAIAG
jgi:hypothetical protein